MNYGIRKKLEIAFENAITKTKEELKKEGFGILTQIDVKATLKKKLDIEFDNYVILGACNPPLAYKALQAEQEIGLLLPCNVIIYEKEKEVFVSAIKPSVAMGMVNNEELRCIAGEVEEKLKKIINNL